MARITVEDCLKKIPNRFQMVLVASVRARQLSQGHTPKIECKDKRQSPLSVKLLRALQA